MNYYELTYREGLRKVLNYGTITSNRTGVSAKTLFNVSFNVDMNNGFPIITGKKIFFRKAYGEFVWMWTGRSDIQFLHEYGVTWWDEYANEYGVVEDSYGEQLRYFNMDFDQIEFVEKEIRSDSRRGVLTFWNPCDVADNKSLPPCYTNFNYVRTGDRLHMSMNLRSSDMFLGLPYDICIGALFLHKMASKCNLEVGFLGVNLANAHIYTNHIAQVKEYLELPMFELPSLIRNDELYGYLHGPLIKAKMNNG